MTRKGRLGNRPGNDSQFTPPEILDRVELVAPIGLDPCSHLDSEAFRRASYAYTAMGLEEDWTIAGQGSLVFVNPPFSDIAPWAARAKREAYCLTEGRPPAWLTSIVLVPTRTSQPYWAELCEHARAVAFWRGNPVMGLSRRVRYWTAAGRQAGAPFDTALFCLSTNEEHVERFCRAFADVATIVRVHQ